MAGMKGTHSGGVASAKGVRIHRSRHKRSKKTGLPPGTLVYIGKERTDPVVVSVIDYQGPDMHEEVVHDLTELSSYRRSSSTTWIMVNGIHNVDMVESIGNMFGIHHLVMEDIVNTTQRAKADDYRDYLFVVLRSLDYDQDRLTSTQMSLVLESYFLLTFQEEATSLLEPIVRRIREGGLRTRDGGTDYLAYCIVDVVVDNYFVVLEKIAEQTELLEEELLEGPTAATLTKIHRMKTDLLLLRKSIWPVIQIANRMTDSDKTLIKDSTRPYLRDLYDHAIHAADTVETFRDMVSGMIDIYLSSVNNRLNEIMKWLTMIATV
ncbi:MAG: magnesium/cobalt transporter CorA, partial [Deltaproteobacteria bacterium]|nr:magnesium/cobalt transporter CorA [Deltaproteobacteria bacterium]